MAEPGPPHRDVLWLFGRVFTATFNTTEEDNGQSGRLAFPKATSLYTHTLNSACKMALPETDE